MNAPSPFLGDQAAPTVSPEAFRDYQLQVLGMLTSGFAHQFNNLLGSLMGNAEIATMDLDENHPAHPALLEILRSTKRARTLTHAILGFGQLSADSPAENEETTLSDVAALLQASLPSWLSVECQGIPEGTTLLPPLALPNGPLRLILIRLAAELGSSPKGVKSVLRLRTSIHGSLVQFRLTLESPSGRIPLLPLPTDPASPAEPSSAWKRTLASVEPWVRPVGGSVAVERDGILVTIPLRSAA